MKTVQFEERYFANQGEWEYFLRQLGIYDSAGISMVTVKVDTDDIKVDFDE